MHPKVFTSLFEPKKNILQDNESTATKIVLFCLLNFINLPGPFPHIDVLSMRVALSVLWCLIPRILNAARCLSVLRVTLFPQSLQEHSPQLLPRPHHSRLSSIPMDQSSLELPNLPHLSHVGGQQIGGKNHMLFHLSSKFNNSQIRNMNWSL